jgi:DNA mismatch repair protein MutS2
MDEALPPPDLLEAIPRYRIDRNVTDRDLVFAFAGSTSGGLFAAALERATVARSSWDPAGYAADLFLERFVREQMALEPGQGALAAPSHLLRTIATPPDDPSTIELRRNVLAELTGQPALFQALQLVHRKLLLLKNLVEGSGGKLDVSRRQLEVLIAFREIVERLDAFGDATSALARLAHFAERVRASEGFSALLALLSYEEKSATLDFRVQLGADGRVRQLDLIGVAESRQSPFWSTPLRRWLAKLELVLRGFRFGDGEVMARLLDAVFEGVRAEFPALVQMLGDVEFYLAALAFHRRVTQAGLAVCLPDFVPSDAPRVLDGLFNPLLLAAGGKAPVPCRLASDRHDTTLLITGPNSGGKTRLLQAVGLAQLLAQAGLFVPARSAKMSLASGLLVSLIQETSADQPEGRLGMELLRIRSLFERLPVGAIVILDELCSGTNPSEGEEIFELVVRMLARLRPQAYITTHFLEFAARLAKSGHIAELRYLQVALGPDAEPTYQFEPGVAKTSLAGQAAKRLGVTGDQLLSLIDQKLASAHVRR